MTISTLLSKSADELEAMTDAQVLEYFGPYLVFVRPTIEAKVSVLKKRSVKLEDDEQVKKIMALIK